jgi:hypothetical protein
VHIVLKILTNIRSAQLREYIAAGTSKEEFVRRLSVALGGQPPMPVTSSSQGQATPDPPADDQRSAAVQALLVERAQRLEADKKAKEAADKAAKEARAKQRRELSDARHSSESSAEAGYAQMVKKRKKEASDERRRILQRIEDDKQERREREAQERQARLLLSANQDPDEAQRSSIVGPPVPLPSRSDGPHCNLQVRLLDGSRIRARFPSDQTLSEHVRKWVDENRTDGDDPYTFRILLTPLPNKAIEPAEESETLRNLGLTPSATLLLVPVVRAATAFERSGGFLWQGWDWVWTMFMLLFGLPGRLFGRRAVAHEEPQYEEIPLENLDDRGSARRRVRGFDDPSARRRDQQLYNGNSVSRQHQSSR